MNKTLTVAALLYCNFILLSFLVAKDREKDNKISTNEFYISTIDFQDTVVFDISQAVFIAGKIKFPVSIKTDDTIYALDFSFKYNESQLTFDTIFDLTNYLQAFSYYNQIDSTVRFTSSSLQAYTHDTSLADIQFTLLSGAIHVNDLFSVNAYLNGDPCSVKIIPPVNTSIDHVMRENFIIDVYPNPARDYINIVTRENVSFEIYDISGRLQLTEAIKTNEGMGISTGSFANGVYFLRITNDGIIVNKKFEVKK